ncbi:unnamed protein product [Lymnaea stagnalis]|uniref:Mediator of RNA polymerase II transcription subunit 15 n=1 Tax=Lymnaea stagnalis TaxID=6523 RepID=A0AAV2HQQ9_LYMST
MERSDMVAGLAEQFMTNWTSDVFRERCVAQIDSVRLTTKPQVNSEDPVEKFLAQNSSKQLEEFVFSHSKTREDYVSLMAEMIMMLRQHGNVPMVDVDVLAGADPEILAAAGVTQNGASNIKDEGDKK